MDGDGAHAVLAAVRLKPAFETTIVIVRDGRVSSLVGVLQFTEVPIGRSGFMRDVSHIGRGPPHTCIDEPLSLVLDSITEPVWVFDRAIGIDEVPAGHQTMAEREALKCSSGPSSETPAYRHSAPQGRIFLTDSNVARMCSDGSPGVRNRSFWRIFAIAISPTTFPK